MTGPERILWKYLKNSCFACLKFRRQHPIGPYVADFCCVQKGLVVELDGESHQNSGKEDQLRDQYMRDRGFTVLRFLNDDVFDDVEAVLKMIAKELGMEWIEAVQKSKWKNE